MLLHQRKAMSRSCSNCGEELLGAVNQCWRCGLEVLTRGGSPQEPLDPQSPQPAGSEPIEAESAEEGSPLEAEIVAEVASDGVTSDGVVEASADPESADPELASERPLVDHSVESEGLADRSQSASVAALTKYPNYMAAGGGAISSVLLAVIACFSAYWLPEGGVVIALLGIGMGAWGLYSSFRNWAVVGVSVCVVALVLSGVGLTVKVHKAIYGYGPFESAPAEMDETGLPIDNPKPVVK